MDFDFISLFNLGFVPFATFGAVAAFNFWKKLDSKQNFLLSVGFAIAFSFVPADWGNVILNKVKDGVSVAVVLNGAYQFLGGVAKKFGASA